MREHWSVIRLLIRRKMPKALPALLLVLVGGVLGGYFWGPKLILSRREAPPFEQEVVRYFLAILFLLGFLGIVASCIFSLNRKSKPQYTLRRLRISETSVFVWNMVIASSLFLMLWGCIVIAVAFSERYYMSMEGYAEGTLGAVVSIMSRDTLLRGLVPVRNPLAWIHTFLLMVCCGVTCACGEVYTLQNRRFPLITVVLLGFFVTIFPVQTAGETLGAPLVTMAIWTWVAIVLTAIYAVHTAKRIARKEDA